MVLLILTRAGFDGIRPRLDFQRDVVWISAGVLMPCEIAGLRASCLNLTVFSHTIDANCKSDAIATITEHHPGQTVWLEVIDVLP